MRVRTSARNPGNVAGEHGGRPWRRESHAVDKSFAARRNPLAGRGLDGFKKSSRSRKVGESWRHCRRCGRDLAWRQMVDAVEEDFCDGLMPSARFRESSGGWAPRHLGSTIWMYGPTLCRQLDTSA